MNTSVCDYCKKISHDLTRLPFERLICDECMDLECQIDKKEFDKYNDVYSITPLAQFDPPNIQIAASNGNEDPYDFDNLFHVTLLNDLIK